MGSRDKIRREFKKPKKDAKKNVVPLTFEQTVEVEVVKKKRKKEEFPE
jgi:hypothetical protein